MSDVVQVPADRLADLERVAAAATAWLRAWSTAQRSGDTVSAFESSKKLAAAVRAAS